MAVLRTITTSAVASAPEGTLMTLRRSHPWLWVRWIHSRMIVLWTRAVDWVLGVRTTPEVPKEARRDACPNTVEMKPWGWFASYRLFRSLGIRPEDVMVDVGAGAGRVVLSLFPFQRVIGVELSNSMHQRAQNNLAQMRVRSRARVEFLRADACDYRLSDDVTLVFMYDPFDGATFRRVIENVFASVDRGPRRLRIAYAYPKEHEYLLELDDVVW